MIFLSGQGSLHHEDTKATKMNHSATKSFCLLILCGFILSGCATRKQPAPRRYMQIGYVNSVGMRIFTPKEWEEYQAERRLKKRSETTRKIQELSQ